MKLLASLVCLVAAIASVFADIEALHPACNVEDTTCVKSAMKSFLKFVAHGIPQYDVKPLDPITLPLLNYNLKKYDVKYTFENTTVLGMKDIKMIDYNIDTATKTVLLRTEANLRFCVTVTIDYNSLKKSFTGLYKGEGKSIITVSYPYELVTGENGTMHFDVKDETIECDAKDTTGDFEEKMVKEMKADPEVAALRSEIFTKGKNNTMNIAFCAMTKQVYKVMVHDIRATAKVVPKESFFKNI